MKYVSRTYSSDEDWNGDCDYLLIDITPQVAKRILEYMDEAARVREKIDSLYCLDIFDYSTQAFSYFEAGGELLDEISGFDGNDLTEVPEGFEIPEDNYQRTECDSVEVQENSFKWKMFVKHTDVRISSPQLDKELLEKIVEKELA
jgi:hypothetical protein